MAWTFYQEVDFADETIMQYHIDTRDFHCATNTTPHKYNFGTDFQIVKNPGRYIHSPEEIRALLYRYFTESGGPGEWRMFTLGGDATFRTSNWQLKYIRIARIPGQGLVIYTNRHQSDSKAIFGIPEFIFSKHLLSSPVEQQYLHKH